jgi:hypothetical protein
MTMRNPFPNPLGELALSDCQLPALVLSRYLFFLTRRPISKSNTHYVQQRINGLKSAGDLLPPGEDRRMQAIQRLLRGLTPQNILDWAERLQLNLLPIAQTVMDRNYIVADRMPPRDFFTSADRILLVLGPAIGIGDEIITFPLADGLKLLNPNAEITLLSGYTGLWEGRHKIDHCRQYQGLKEIIKALRGESQYGNFDLVVLVDFEYPELYQAISFEKKIPRYMELSLGAQVLVAVDNLQGWAYREILPTGYYDNYYDTFDFFLRKLNIPHDMEDRFNYSSSRNGASPDRPLHVYVSPFTSKYDPSPNYWSRLLAGLAPASPLREICFFLDPGPNATTKRFAMELLHSLSSQDNRQTTFEVAKAKHGPILTIGEVFEILDQTDIVICADSFTAHAAPSMGCTTLVVANAGVENWRVPCHSSYYFNLRSPLSEIIAAMSQIFSHFGIEPIHACYRPPIAEPETRLISIMEQLKSAFTEGEQAKTGDLIELYTQFTQQVDPVLSRLSNWAPAAKALLMDYPYESAFRQIPKGSQTLQDYGLDISHFIHNTYLGWRNTNLFKYIHLNLSEREHAGQPVRP